MIECAHVYLRAECGHVSDNLEREAQHCELTGGRHREADSLARCFPPGLHPPLPLAEEQGVAWLQDPGLQNLEKKTNAQSTSIDLLLKWVTVFLSRTSLNESTKGHFR